MADSTNINMGVFSDTPAIALGSTYFSEVWLGSDLLWKKATGSWVNYVSNNMLMVEYTPVVDTKVYSFTMVLDKNTSVYNYVASIFKASDGSKVQTDTGTSGVSIVAGETLDGVTMYTHTKTYGSTGPTLTAGVSYHMCVGERYSSYQAWSGTSYDDGDGSSAAAWSLTNTQYSNWSSLGTKLYLKVVAA